MLAIDSGSPQQPQHQPADQGRKRLAKQRTPKKIQQYPANDA